MTKGQVAGIILAAGESSRMGRDKALLPLGTQTFVGSLLAVLSGRVNPIMVVLGHHADEIEQAIAPWVQRTPGAQVVRNPKYKLGQLSSLQVALRALAGKDIAGAVVCLVDHPAIPAEVIEQLLERFARSAAPLLIPSHDHRRGHPVLFAAPLFPELLAAPLAEGARAVVSMHENEIEYVETAEESVVWDIDRPEDYDRLVRRWR
jgi:molybdenum cofactor cytidylyltransferase